MNRLSQTLTLVLAAQLVLVVFAFWPTNDAADNRASTALLSMDTESINRFSVSDRDTSVLIERAESGWIMPEYHGLPADAGRVERTLIDLPALARGWPVASSDGAATRFEVAESNFQRRIQYFQDGSAPATLYVGTSPGFRKVHTRVEGQNPVYAVEYNSFDLPAQAAEWLDKTLLQVDDAQFISGIDYKLSLDGDAWNDTQGNSADPSQVDSLVNGLSSLRVTSAADIATAAILEEMNAPPTIKVTTLDGDYDFRLFEIEDAYYVQRADIPVFFSLSSFDYNRLNDVNAAKLFAGNFAEENDAELGDNGNNETEPVN